MQPLKTRAQHQKLYQLLAIALIIVLSLGLCGGTWNTSNASTLIAYLPPGNAVTNPNALLRQALPLDHQAMLEVQEYLDNASMTLTAATPKSLKKSWAEVQHDTDKAVTAFSQHRADILEAIPADHRDHAADLVDTISQALMDLKGNSDLKNENTFKETSIRLVVSLNQLEKELIGDRPFLVPRAYQNLPQLNGRATVVLETTQGPMTVVVDGYSAPVTAGNFVDLVQRGFYRDLPFTRAEESYVLQTGDPGGAIDGFIDPQTRQARTIPLEILVQGDTEPTYGDTLEDLGRYQDKPVLPFSAYGTLAMARPGDDPNGGSSQFFFLLFEPDLTPAGLNLLDGRYSVFGYTIAGQEALAKLQQGDKILSAKVIQGLENLVVPS
ncbi:MAG: peptidylprolyl isomerase [Thermosynechococcaceae cyanobacterium]